MAITCGVTKGDAAEDKIRKALENCGVKLAL